MAHAGRGAGGGPETHTSVVLTANSRGPFSPLKHTGREEGRPLCHDDWRRPFRASLRGLSQSPLLSERRRQVFKLQMPETQFLGQFRMSGSSISKSFSVIQTVAGAEGHRSPPLELPGQAGASAGAERQGGWAQGPGGGRGQRTGAPPSRTGRCMEQSLVPRGRLWCDHRT